jgi:tetratricopeptide (TPR) repeat protein
VVRSSERSLALGAPREELWKLRMARAEALRFLLRRDEQHSELLEALAVATTDAERAQTRRQLTFFFQRSGRLAEAVEMGSQAVADADASGDAIVRALARSTLAQSCVFSGASDRADALLREAEALATDAGPAVRAQIAEAQALSATVQGDVGRTRTACAVAVDLFREAGNVREAASSEQNLADAYNRIGAWAEARHALEDALDGCRRVRNRVGEAYALANLGYACAKLAATDQALESLAEAARLAAEMSDTRLAAAVRVYRARVHLALGEHADLAREAEEAAADASGSASARSTARSTSPSVRSRSATS